jgi:transcription-repair coupling factor (superfamily II helicase)
VLGENQSGEIQQVGVSLYTEMLKRAVRDLQQGKEPDLSQPLEVVSEINLHAPALLPNDYCSDVQERLTLYKRLANCESDDDLQALQEELIDRFGEMPPRPAPCSKPTACACWSNPTASPRWTPPRARSASSSASAPSTR